ncbi:hypothetical protein AAFF_G00149070 [Aldrovandia affinis]|uniref:Rho-GAP domain-containing protein n=1 Tax=Aldrovandia affinis TaxID=143900 RepID=A0AAD7RPF5_9TELE|nr:hypothetical protein AAFF_G00149070 [Aldrovandia affinis]
MPESKQAACRSGSHLSGATYRRIRRVLSFRRRVFGQRLEETVVYERRYGEHTVPLVVEQCVAFIRDHGLREVGLFRQPGQATLVKELQEAFDAGEKPSFDSSTDVHTVASLLKLYLRELPEPVVPFSRYQDFLLCGKQILTDRKQGLLELKTVLHELPVANFNLLNYICQFLNEVQAYSSSNKMTIQNLATVFGPNILRPKAEDPESIMGGAAVVQQLMSELIGESGLLFLGGEDAVARPDSAPFPEGACTDPVPPPGPANKGPPGTTGPSALPPPAPPAFPHQRAGFPSKLPHRCRAPPTVRDGAPPLGTPSPRSPVNPLYENFLRSRCWAHLPPPPPPPPLPPHLGLAAAGKAGPRLGLGPRDRRRAGDAHESTLSVYDNMDAGSRRAAETEEGTTSAGSSSWSSCEVLLEGGSPPSLRTDPEEPRFNSPASSAPMDAPHSSGSSEVFLPSTPQALHPSSNTVHCLVARLRQQMAQQKLEYESRIRSLEQQNEALQVEVTGLRTGLDQQRRWYSVAEMKMRDAERARADAERRNTALQREMEQFFDTFGELSHEAKRAERILQSF